jgi:hypothetical protein
VSVLHRNSSTSFPPTAAILPSLDMFTMAGGAEVGGSGTRRARHLCSKTKVLPL